MAGACSHRQKNAAAAGPASPTMSAAKALPACQKTESADTTTAYRAQFPQVRSQRSCFPHPCASRDCGDLGVAGQTRGPAAAAVAAAAAAAAAEGGGGGGSNGAWPAAPPCCAAKICCKKCACICADMPIDECMLALRAAAASAAPLAVAASTGRNGEPLMWRSKDGV